MIGPVNNSFLSAWESSLTEAQGEQVSRVAHDVEQLRDLWIKAHLDSSQEPDAALLKEIQAATTTLRKLTKELTSGLKDLSEPEQRQLTEWSDYAFASQKQVSYALASKTPISAVALGELRDNARTRTSRQFALNDNRYWTGAGAEINRDLEARTLLTSQGRRIIDVPRDGNCGPSAIAMGAYPQAPMKETATKLRADMVAKLRPRLADRRDLGQFIIEDPNAYCDRMAISGPPGTWIDQPELKVFAEDILKRPIWVYRPDNMSVNEKTGVLEPTVDYKYGPRNTDAEPIRLYFFHNHYQLIV